MNTFTPEKPWSIPSDTSVPWGEAPGASIPSPPKDGRTIALERLRDYLCSFEFHRDSEHTFQFNPDAFYIDGPDSEDTFTLPTISVLPGAEVRNDVCYAALVESSRDVFKRGYTLVRITEHEETLNLELWAGTKAERRAVLSAIDQMFTPNQQMTGLRLVLPEYWYQTCRYTLKQVDRMNDEGGKNRWKAMIQVMIEFSIVRLVSTTEIRPSVGVCDD